MKYELKALSDTLLKWLKVSRGLLGDKGNENCPLCKLYYNKGDCTKCPIKNKTGRAKCDGTPYEKWTDHHDCWHKLDTVKQGYIVRCSECKELARDMFYFILDIIEKR